MTVLDMLELIKTKPMLYLGTNSIRDLCQFLSGFSACAYENGFASHQDYKTWHSFGIWLKEEHRDFTTVGWDKTMVRIYPDDGTALQKLFNMWDQYKELKSE